MFNSFRSPVPWLILLVASLTIFLLAGSVMIWAVQFALPDFGKPDDARSIWFVPSWGVVSIYGGYRLARRFLDGFNRLQAGLAEQDAGGTSAEGPPATDPMPPAETPSPADIRFAARIRIASGTGTVVGGSLGVLFIISAWNLDSAYLDDPNQSRALFSAPIVVGAIGNLAGWGLACLFAPASFLTGPLGRPYLEKLGVRSVAGARRVCAALVLVVMSPVLLVGFIFLGAALGWGKR